MFKHVFINRLKITLKNKAMIFWTLIFPILLATFFNLAFSNLTEEEKFKAINIGVVNADVELKQLVGPLSTKENEVFKPQYVSEKKAKQLLEDNKIDGYLIKNEKIEVVVKRNGTNQSVIKYIVDNYYQINSALGSIINYDSTIVIDEIVKNLDNNYFKDISNENVDPTIVYFYTLIGMACLYGGFFGVIVVNETEANLSKKGARVSVAPTHKLKVLICSLLVALLVQYAENLLLLAYLILVLGIDFGNQLLPILVLVFFGSLAGITMGTLIGSSIKKSEDFKTGMVTSFTMIFSFLAGMMVLDMKYIVAEKVPILAKINPVSMITDGLYSLYYYDNLNRYIYNVISLLIFSSVMVVVSYMFIRRKKYDSI